MENSLIGRFALSKVGHDKNVLYVIIAQDAKYLYLCDGKFHTLEKPKKKFLRHVAVYKDCVESELQQRIINKEKVFDHEIKYAIRIQQE